MKIIKICEHCQNKTAQIKQLQEEKHFWIEMCNNLAEENNYLHNRTVYGIVKRTVQILKHVRLP